MEKFECMSRYLRVWSYEYDELIVYTKYRFTLSNLFSIYQTIYGIHFIRPYALLLTFVKPASPEMKEKEEIRVLGRITVMAQELQELNKLLEQLQCVPVS